MEFEITERDEFNEFTGSLRESNLPPGPNEPICLISYEITVILLGDGPHSRSSFWKSYHREVAINKKTDFRNYHVHLCRNELVSLQMKLDSPVYFKNDRLTFEKQLDPYTNTALGNPRFNYQPALQTTKMGKGPKRPENPRQAETLRPAP